MPDHAASSNLGAQIDRMTQVAQAAIDLSNKHADQMTEVRLSLQKISTTQDQIAEKFSDGKAKMNDHEVRIRALEAVKSDDHEIRIQAIEDEKRTTEGFFRALRLLGQAAWAVVAFAFVGLLGLFGYLLKYYGHAS